VLDRTAALEMYAIWFISEVARRRVSYLRACLLKASWIFRNSATEPDLPISYNIAPSQPVLAIRFNPETKQRSLDTLLWGLVPCWSKDDKTGFINARAERIDLAPAFRRTFQKRRRLIPAFTNGKRRPRGKFPIRSK